MARRDVITFFIPSELHNFCLGDRLSNDSIVVGKDLDRGQLLTLPATWYRRLFWWARGWARHTIWLARCYWCDFKEWCTQ
jgi:hypothetical protein